MKRFTRTTRFAAVAALALATIAATACSSEAPTGASPTAQSTDTRISIAPVDAAVKLLPESVSRTGVLRVAIPTNEPPTQFYAEGTQVMTGINPDIAALLADALDLKLEVVVSNFDSIIPGLAANRFDATVSSMTPTSERLTQLDFVEYMNMGSALVVPKANTANITFDTLCGKRVAVLTGSYQLTVQIPQLNERCTSAQQKPLHVQQFQDTRQAISSLTSGRSDVVYADGPILSYAAVQNSDIVVAGENDVAPVGIGIAKNSGLLAPIEAAMRVIITTPEYREVLGTYGVESMALETVRVNVAQ